jgi:hypothetical protein
MTVPNLQSSDATNTSQGGSKWGAIWGGGMDFSFGGINDNPVGKTVWYAVIAAVALIAVVFFWKRKP